MEEFLFGMAGRGQQPETHRDHSIEGVPAESEEIMPLPRLQAIGILLLLVGVIDHHSSHGFPCTASCICCSNARPVFKPGHPILAGNINVTK